MRTVAELPHPECKITIFSMNQKFIIKFEQESLEQVYKISEFNIPDGINGVFQILDDEFIGKVIIGFKAMRTQFNEAFVRYDSF